MNTKAETLPLRSPFPSEIYGFHSEDDLPTVSVDVVKGYDFYCGEKGVHVPSVGNGFSYVFRKINR